MRRLWLIIEGVGEELYTIWAALVMLAVWALLLTLWPLVEFLDWYQGDE